MELLASGRDCEVFRHGEGQVLRRSRSGRPADREASLMRALHAAGYPVPAVVSVDGPELVLEYVEGPLLADAVMTGLPVDEGARMLARLHDDLHSLQWPSGTLLHMDLHPANVILGRAGPVVIDWTNARTAPAGLDVAMTMLIMAQLAVAPQLPPSLTAAVRSFMGAFAGAVAASYVEHLPAALELRRADPHQSAAELLELGGAMTLARSLAESGP